MAGTGKRILAGIDDSDGGRAALAWAVLEAERRSLPLTLAHSWAPDFTVVPTVSGPSPAFTEVDRAYEGAEADARRWLDAQVERTRDHHTGIDVTGDLSHLSPAAHLLDLAGDAEMVVVGSRGRGSFTALLLGSTSQQIASHAPCPVVVLRGDADATATGPVVVGVDGSPAADHALGLAFVEAQVRRTSLVVLHAWSTPLVGTIAATAQSFEMVREAEVDEGWRTIADSLKRLRAQDTGVEVDERLLQGNPAAALVEASQGASLVVVGSRGRGGFKGLLLGSVSQAVLHHAHAPIMVVRD